MVFLRRLLDDPGAEPCGRCDRCTGEPLDPAVPTALAAEAGAFLRSATLVIEPRKQWMLGTGRPRIAKDEQAEAGRALGVVGDGGWGPVVRGAMAAGERFPDELLDAAARVIGAWRPEPPPTWVTSVPSRSPGDPVAEFARRLAAALELPYREAVRRVRDRPPQRDMANSVQQLTNVQGAFAVDGPVPDGPVLLVDDLVDSGWTLTVLASLLRQSGCSGVRPFALARAVSG
jgi:ATP-dependent DNA helicase RecQ